jgi:hypothetical protein
VPVLALVAWGVVVLVLIYEVGICRRYFMAF